MRRAGLCLAVAVALTMAILPLYWMVLTALRPTGAVMRWPPRLLPDPAELTLDVFRDLLATAPLGAWLGNALLIAVTSTVLTVVVACGAGYALSRSRLWTTRAMGHLVLVAKMLPGTLLVVPLYIVFFRAGLLDAALSPFAVVLANMTFAVPVATWMMKAFFDGIPMEIEEAAALDGSAPLRTLVELVLPAAAPAVAAVTVYVFIVAWNDFIYAATFMPGGAQTTIAVASTQFLSEVEMAWNKVMAVATLAALPVLAVFFVLERWFVAGLVRAND